jgi:hypothetical protein
MRVPKRNRRIVLVALAGMTLSSLGACTITQEVKPATVAADTEVCVIENEAVREGFLSELQKSLTANGYRYRMLPSTATTSDCPVTLTYVARWSWDLTLYMSYARLQVFDNGQAAGDAVYDATQGGGNMSKFIDAEPKIRELVTQLLPPRTQ